MTDRPDTPTAEPAAANPDENRAALRRPMPQRALLGAGALAVFALGLAGGALAWNTAGHPAATFDADLAVTPIAQLHEASQVGISGEVAEIYGNKFVVSADGARALVETGRRGEGGRLVTTGETVTVQGRFRDGFLHAGVIRHADGRTDALDPPPPPPHGGPEAGRHGNNPAAQTGAPSNGS